MGGFDFTFRFMSTYDFHITDGDAYNDDDATTGSSNTNCRNSVMELFWEQLSSDLLQALLKGTNPRRQNVA